MKTIPRKGYEKLEDLLQEETEAQRNKWLDQGDQEEGESKGQTTVYLIVTPVQRPGHRMSDSF